MRSGIIFLLVFLLFAALAISFAEWQEESFLHEGGMVVMAHSWESKVYIYPGGDTLRVSLKGETQWSGNDLRVIIAPGQPVTVSTSFEERSLPGQAEKDFWAIHAQMAVSESGYEGIATLTSHTGKGMDVWLVDAKSLFNGTVNSDSIEGEFRGKIVVVPR